MRTRTLSTAALTAAVLLSGSSALAATQLPPSVTSDAAQLASASAQRQADLVTGEDQRLTNALHKVRPDQKHPGAAMPPKRTEASGLYTLVLTKRRAPYTFDELRKLSPDTLLPQPGGSFLLREHIIVAQGATLAISPRKPLVVKMSSGPDGFVSLVTEGGRLRLNGTAVAPITFESWDESRGQQDQDVSDGRAYIRASGQLIVRHASFSRLGFWSGRTGGLSVVGSGVALGSDLDSGTDSLDHAGAGRKTAAADVLPAGKLPAGARDPSRSFASQISDATIFANAYGLFVTGSSGLRISHTTIRNSLVDGLLLHRNVDSATVSNVQVEQSGEDGVVVSREVEGTVLTRLSVRQNGRDGVVLAGRPLAYGPSASGSSTRAFGNNVLTSSQSIDNARIGVHVIGGTAVRVQGNVVSGGRSGIVVSDGATDIDLDSNRVASAAGNGIQVRESRQVAVTANVVQDSPTGIHVRNSVSDLRQNSTSGVTLHGITFVGRVTGSVAAENRLAGSGTSAIDVVRVADHQEPTLRQNDLAGWSRTVTGDSLLSVLLHPLTVIWMLVALALLGMSRPRRTGGIAPNRSARAASAPPSSDPATGHELTPDRVITIPAGRQPAPAPAPMSAPSLAPPFSPSSPVPSSPVPASASTPIPRRAPVRIPRPAAAPRPALNPRPDPAPRPAPAVIDLAIHDSWPVVPTPVVPRRRRVVGR